MVDNLTLIGISANEIKLSWMPPAIENGILSSYFVEYTNRNTSVKFDTSNTTITLKNLTAYTNYTITVSTKSLYFTTKF